MRRAAEVVPALRLACPYCGAAREHKGSTFPPDACCLPRALEQAAWMTEFVRDPKADPQEASQVRGSLREVREAILAASQEEVEGALEAVRNRHAGDHVRIAAVARVAKAIRRAYAGR